MGSTPTARTLGADGVPEPGERAARREGGGDRRHAEHHDQQAHQPQVDAGAVERAFGPLGEVDREELHLVEPGAGVVDAACETIEVGGDGRERRRGRVQVGRRAGQLIAETPQLIRHRFEPVGQHTQVFGQRVGVARDEPLDGLHQPGEAVGDAARAGDRVGDVRAERGAELVGRRGTVDEEAACFVDRRRRGVGQRGEVVGEPLGRGGTERSGIGPLGSDLQPVAVGGPDTLGDREPEHRGDGGEYRHHRQQPAHPIDTAAGQCGVSGGGRRRRWGGRRSGGRHVRHVPPL
ncbi:MAG: hypothetical protein R2743_01185 [Ilumatobacteraceae bacterium]